MDVVEFPGLWGLKFSINRVAFDVFGISIYWYGIIIAAAFLSCVLLGMRHSRKFGLEPDNVIDLVLFAAPAAIVCARLYYVIFSWEDFKDNPVEIFNTRNGGLAIYGAIIGAFIVAYIFAKAKKIGVLRLLDFAVPYLPLGQAIGRWGNFVNQEAFGTNTTLPWGMTSNTVKMYLINNYENLKQQGILVNPEDPVHPTFLYESLWNIGAFFILIWYRNKRKPQGEVLFLYMILYGLGRFWIEGLRTDSLMIGNLRISQLLSGVFAVVFLIILFIRRKKVSEETEIVDMGSSEYGNILKHILEEENINSENIQTNEDNADKEYSDTEENEGQQEKNDLHNVNDENAESADKIQ